VIISRDGQPLSHRLVRSSESSSSIVKQHVLFSPVVPRRCPRDTSAEDEEEEEKERRRERERETEKDEIALVLARRTRRDPTAVTALFRAEEFQSLYSVFRLTKHSGEKRAPFAVALFPPGLRTREPRATGNR